MSEQHSDRVEQLLAQSAASLPLIAMPPRTGPMPMFPEIPEPDWTLVRRVPDDTGSHVEPELDQSWPDLWKLRWCAASVGSEVDTRIHISESSQHHGWFGASYRVGTASVGTSQSSDFGEMWAWLVGLRAGFEIAQRNARCMVTTEHPTGQQRGPVCCVLPAGHVGWHRGEIPNETTPPATVEWRKTDGE